MYTKGDFHIHSNYPIEPSHDLGQNTMEEMLEKAKELNYEYFGFSEHNPSVGNHTEQEIYSILLDRSKKIEQPRKSNKSVRIINLLEVDILTTGKLALSDRCLELLDMAIVSIHSSFKTPRKNDEKNSRWSFASKSKNICTSFRTFDKPTRTIRS